MKIKTLVLGAMFVSLAAPALAHHSFAMFDAEKTATLEGTVRNSSGPTRTAGS
jgi:hypothetical protein